MAPITIRAGSRSPSQRRAGDVHRTAELPADRRVEYRLHRGRGRRKAVVAPDVVDGRDQQRLAEELVVRALRVVAVRLTELATESGVELGALGRRDHVVGVA